TLYELPSAYKNAWDVVKIAEKLSLAPGVYQHSGFMLCDMLLSLKPNYSMRSIEKRVAETLRDDEANELIETFMAYCESFFSKQLAAEKLHLHRNTLSYRLQKLEERLGLRFDDFPQVNAYYLALKRIKLI
ncbi:MAG: helix-turn-helix domain-containing protein, partial [Cloacibacillus sp.]